jgi:hypothetical protein
MSFFEGQSEGKDRRPQRRSWRDTFVQFVPGQPVTIRIIEPDAADNKVWKHYIPQAETKSGKRGMTVPCPGIEICPICARNKELGDREHKDYVKAFPSYYVHCLDLTPVKTCDLCGTANFGNTCTYDDNDLSDLPFDEPVVKILEGNRTLFEQIDTVESTIQAAYDPERPSMYHSHKDLTVQADYKSGREVTVPVGVTGYPLQLVTTKSERQRIITPVPAGPPDDFDWREYEDQRFDKWDAWLELEPEELIQLVNGAKLVDLLKARSGQEPSDESVSLDSDLDSAL